MVKTISIINIGKYIYVGLHGKNNAHYILGPCFILITKIFQKIVRQEKRRLIHIYLPL